MKAIVRNVLLACLISTFALFGALGRKHTKQVLAAMTVQQQTSIAAESRKETLTCLTQIAFLLPGRFVYMEMHRSSTAGEMKGTKEYQRRFNEYMRRNSIAFPQAGINPCLFLKNYFNFAAS